MRNTVYIHTNDKQYIGAKVAEHALRRYCSSSNFEIQIIRLEDYPALYDREGQKYLRNGRQAVWSNADLQSFTPTRFLPPQLSNYEGRALVIDPDVFAIGDVCELLNMDMQGKSILCRRILPADGRSAYWASSVMLLDCEQLTHWRWEEAIDEMFTFKRDYRNWMSLHLEPDQSIGILPDEWNHFDLLNDQTKMLHTTNRLTQPWKTGLPIDFKWDNSDNSKTKAWLRRTKLKLLGMLGRGVPTTYQPHPDRRQEHLFFSLLKECIDNGSVTYDELRSEIEAQHIRNDAIECIALV